MLQNVVFLAHAVTKRKFETLIFLHLEISVSPCFDLFYVNCWVYERISNILSITNEPSGN